ncbi:MAG: tRNA pseudouridine(55) synthase TruB [Bacilli bacterium]|nr:tRNA pseudouridine(55) synthase TruB [Bacilli bacterium]
MNGILLIDKEKGITSRDVVNKLNKILNTKKIGHTGTLDPIATGLMVICVNKGCKLVELLTNHDKEYIATVKMGIRTDTYDITGKILEESNNYQITKEELEKVLKSFIGKYQQEVPIYSSIKVDGKKLYEYARNNIPVTLPVHEVEIYSIELIDFNNDTFSFKVSVSKGTYIRSLINDIGKKLNIPITMMELRRTKVGDFSIKDSIDVNMVNESSIIPIKDAINIKKIIINDNDLLKKISNGVKLKLDYADKYIMFINNDKCIGIYYKDNDCYRVYNLF